MRLSCRLPPSCALAIFLVLPLLAACGGDSPTGPDGADDGQIITSDPAASVTPSADTLIAIGAERDFSAGLQRPDGSSAPDSAAAWSSTDTAVAVVDGEGVAVARAAGSARIVARFQGVADTATLVVAPEVATVTVSPAADTVEALGGEAQLVGEAADANSHPVASAALAWSSSDTVVASVDSSGTVTGGLPGEADIVATSEGIADTARVVVVDPDGDQAPLADVEAPTDSTSFAPGDTITFRGSGTDLEDGTLTGSSLAWSSDLDGAIGTGEQVETGILSSGDHVVTLTATDSQGQTGTDSVRVTIRQPANLTLDGLRTHRRGLLTSEAGQAGGVVVNTGGADAGGFGWELYVDGTLVTRGAASGLASGDTLYIPLQDLGTLTEGRHRVDLTVDVFDEVDETDEGDNAGWDRIVSYPAGFAIELDYLTQMDSTHRAAFDEASARWAEIITADLPDVSFSSPENLDWCAQGAGDRSQTIDDVLIYVRVDSIDGEYGTLGQAGPCAARWDAERGYHLTAIVGAMTFDEADLDRMAADGELKDVILHEMGHVLGIGSFWNNHDLREDAGTDDPIYTGAAGQRGFSEVGGDSYTGRPVPLANTGGMGTRDAHWRESVFEHELMTGYLNSGRTNPLSLVTVRSLGDQYYAVDPAAADSYQLPGSSLLRLGAGRRIDLGDDHLLNIPVRGLDRHGQVMHVDRRPLRPGGER